MVRYREILGLTALWISQRSIVGSVGCNIRIEAVL